MGTVFEMNGAYFTVRNNTAVLGAVYEREKAFAGFKKENTSK
jgi:hypothetical protein